MKQLLLLIAILFNFSTYAQKDCDYSSNVTDSLGTYKSTKDYLMHEKVFGGTETSIYFSLINADGLPSLNLQIIQKSKDFVPANCINNDSKLYFQLENGKIITLLPTGDETCGTTLRKDDNNIRIISTYFIFVKEKFEELKKSPISIMRINFSSGFKDYVVKSELKSEINSNTYNPNNYFINYLKCIE